MGFVMRRYDFPIAPCVIGLILGPLAEQNFRRALQISQGDWSVFVTHPLSLFFLIVALLVFATPFVLRAMTKRLTADTQQEPAS